MLKPLGLLGLGGARLLPFIVLMALALIGAGVMAVW